MQKLAGVRRSSCVNEGVFCGRKARAEQEDRQLTPSLPQKLQLSAQVNLNKSDKRIEFLAAQIKWIP